MAGEGPLVALCAFVLLATAAAQGEAAPAVEKRITGRVLDTDGKPIAGAAVGVFAQGSFVDTAELLAHPPHATAADGTFAIAPGSVPWNSVVIAANGRQCCAMPITEALLSNGGAFDDVLLPPGAKLIGRVRDAGGAPLAGVRIRVESSIVDLFGFDRPRLLAGAVSDAKGIFQVAGVPRTGLKLTASKEGWLTQVRLASQQSPVDLTMQQVGVVRGRVVDAAGKPVAGVSVNGVTVETREADDACVTGTDGSFAITVPKRGRFRVAGHERQPPYRQFSSGLLRGAADDVILTEGGAAAVASAQLEVVVVDAQSHAPIPKFGLSQQNLDASNLQLAWKEHRRSRREYEGRARLAIERRQGQPAILVIDAPGHGFEVVAVPEQFDRPLQVELGSEAVLTGKVVDAVTNQPMAGVAVAALPKGNSSGSGGRAVDFGPLTDDQGNYRIAGLRPGDYGVQVHAADRPASAPQPVTLEPGKEARLDLTAPAPLLLRFTLTGRFPDHPGARLSRGMGSFSMSSGTMGRFEHSVQPPPEQPMNRAGKFEIGPVGRGTIALQLFLPSRARIGTGTTVRLGEVEAGAAPVEIALPELHMRIVRGRVVLPPDVPTERVGIAVDTLQQRRDRFRTMRQPTLAGIDRDGNFELDLPDGSYCLQLIDQVTTIAFHTEDRDLVVDGDTKPLTIRPGVHWLEVECVPEHAGDDAILQSIGIELPRPRGGAASAFLRSSGSHNDVEHGYTPFRLGETSQRWLVPPGPITVIARQTFEMLQPWARGWKVKEVGKVEVEVDEPEQRVVFTVPAPPSDEDLMRRKD